MKHRFRTIIGVAAIAASSLVAAPSNSDLSGRWAASLKEGSFDVPFRLDLAVDGSKVVGKLYNGSEDFETTSSAEIKDGKLILNFQHYMTSITADVKDGQLDGNLTLVYRSPIDITPGAAPYPVHDYVAPFHATRYVAPSKNVAAVKAPSIDGVTAGCPANSIAASTRPKNLLPI